MHAHPAATSCSHFPQHATRRRATYARALKESRTTFTSLANKRQYRPRTVKGAECAVLFGERMTRKTMTQSYVRVGFRFWARLGFRQCLTHGPPFHPLSTTFYLFLHCVFSTSFLFRHVLVLLLLLRMHGIRTRDLVHRCMGNGLIHSVLNGSSGLYENVLVTRSIITVERIYRSQNFSPLSS